MKTLDNFIVSMNHMSDVVMVPNRLKDIEVKNPSAESADKPRAHTALVPVASADTSNAQDPDLFSFYRMLQCVQHELCFGSDELHVKRASSSGGSSGRSSGAESPLESDLESDGDLTEIRDPRAHQLATNFKIHLQGLADVVNQLTLTADFLSERYQEDMGNNGVSEK